MKKSMDCDDIGWLTEYVGCKIEINRETRELKFTQPVLIQSFSDEFRLPEKNYSTPAEAKQVLKHAEDMDLLGE